MSTNKPVGGAQFTPGPWVVNTFIVNGQHKLEVLDATGANACVQVESDGSKPKRFMAFGCIPKDTCRPATKEEYIAYQKPLLFPSSIF